jgi:uncharacterized protein YlzI (FlbEa/FlbD family)
MSEYIKLTTLNPESELFIKKRQISSVVAEGFYGGSTSISMMGGSVYNIKESIEEVKKLLNLDSL